MPFALVIIGLVLIVTGAKDTYQQLGKQVVSDFTGENNFTWWLVSLGAVGSLGYVKAIRPFSQAFLILIILAMVIKNGGFFQLATAALEAGPEAPPKNAGTTSQGAPMMAEQLSEGRDLAADKDVVVQAQTEASENVQDNATTFFDFLGKFFLGGPAY